MLEDVERADDVEGPGRKVVVLDRALEHGDAERLAREGRNPRADLETGGVEAGLLEECDKASVGGAELEHPRRRETVGAHRAVRSLTLRSSRVGLPSCRWWENQ